MKKIAILLLLFVSFPVYAGFYVGRDFKYYEPAKNLWYISIGEVKKNKEISNNVIKNIAIVNLNSNETNYLFDKEFDENIQDLYFETDFRNKDGVVEFNSMTHIKNNNNIQVRAIKDRLCIITYNTSTQKYSLWFSNKIGKGLNRVKSFSKDTDWWIDIRNSRIYFIRQIESKIHLESIEW